MSNSGDNKVLCPRCKGGSGSLGCYLCSAKGAISKEVHVSYMLLNTFEIPEDQWRDIALEIFEMRKALGDLPNDTDFDTCWWRLPSR